MDKETVQRVEARVKDGIYRNKSHFIELATQRMLEKGEGKQEKKDWGRF